MPLFGVGLSRPVEGNYADAVKEMNKAEGFKLALDVPKRYLLRYRQSAGCAFLADATVTFGFCKRGLVLYPGGNRLRRGGTGLQMWGSDRRALGQSPEMYTYDSCEQHLPDRTSSGE